MSGDDIGSTSSTPLERYIAALPEGLDSYPGHTIKASFTRALLDEIPKAPRGLPGAVGLLVDNPPVISAWVPEVHHQALLLGVAEQVFDGDARAFLDEMLQIQRRLLARKIYAPLLQFIDPARLLKHATRRWTNFHRGTVLHAESLPNNETRILLSHPPGIFSPMGREALAGGFRAAMEAGDADEVDVVLVKAGDERAEFRGRWS